MWVTLHIILKVVIHKFEDDMFFAHLVLNLNGEDIIIDSITSDVEDYSFEELEIILQKILLKKDIEVLSESEML